MLLFVFLSVALAVTDVTLYLTNASIVMVEQASMNADFQKATQAANTDGNQNKFPSGQGPTQAIDNSLEKALDLDGANHPTGFIVQSMSSVVTAINLWQADDNTERDPASYVLYGSNVMLNTAAASFSLSDFTVIQNGSVSLPTARNGASGSLPAPGQTITITATPADYSVYALIFPTVRGGTTDVNTAMQIAEFQIEGFFLLADGMACNAPADCSSGFCDATTSNCCGSTFPTRCSDGTPMPGCTGQCANSCEDNTCCGSNGGGTGTGGGCASAVCTANGQCVSGTCNLFLVSGVCCDNTNPSQLCDGATCTNGTECASGSCNSNNVCCGNKAPFECDGAICTTGSDCATGHCNQVLADSNQCCTMDPSVAANRCDGLPCTTGGDCVEGDCEFGKCCSSEPPNGCSTAVCTGDNTCVSGSCDSTGALAVCCGTASLTCSDTTTCTALTDCTSGSCDVSSGECCGGTTGCSDETPCTVGVTNCAAGFCSLCGLCGDGCSCSPGIQAHQCSRPLSCTLQHEAQSCCSKLCVLCASLMCHVQADRTQAHFSAVMATLVVTSLARLAMRSVTTLSALVA
jgi:hypothetical protein